MRFLFLLPLFFLFTGCGNRSNATSELWLNGYNHAILLPAKDDRVGIGSVIEEAFKSRGFTVTVSRGERIKLDHEAALSTLVVSFATVPGSLSSQRVDIFCRDYNKGLVLSDGQRDRCSLTASLYGEKPAAPVAEYVTEWIDDHRDQYDANAVLLRPSWWTNVERNMGADRQ